MQPDEYVSWVPKVTPDAKRRMADLLINSTDKANAAIAEGFREIVAVEGPVLSTRLFTLYARSGGLSKLTPQVRKRFAAALKTACLNKQFAYSQDPSDGAVVLVLRLPDQPEVQVRELGGRSILDVPANELAEVMFELSSAGDKLLEGAPLMEAVARFYQLKKLSDDARKRLETVYKEFLA